MESFEPKKLALIRIWQILKDYSDFDHPLTQEDIAVKLQNEYGIILERKAISRNISLLKEAGIDIESRRAGSYLECRDFEDSELHMLIDGVLSSKYITAKHSKDIINRLCGLSNKYFRSNVKHIHSVNDWYKTDNQALFYNIELIDTAIEEGKQVHYDYNKYGTDKKLHKSSHQYVTPYLMVLHNQRYYLTLSGIFFENFVANELIAKEHKLFYWRGKASAELEFIIESNNKLYPLDVKKGRGTLNSLEKFSSHNKFDYAIKVSKNNYGFNPEQKLLTIPFYFIPFVAQDLANGTMKV